MFYVVEKSQQFGWIRERSSLFRTRELSIADIGSKIWWGMARCTKQTMFPSPFIDTLRPAAVTDKMLARLDEHTTISALHLVDTEDTGRALGAYILFKLQQIREHLIV
jgi:hypothetical protein